MLKRMATLLGGSLAGQLVTIVAAFVLTRLYSPEAFAHLEMFALATGLAAVLGTGKYEQALMLPKAEADARVLFAAGQRAVGITVFVVFVLTTLSASWVSTRYGLEQWTVIAYALPLFCAFAAHTRLLEYWHHRNAEAGKVATAQAAGPLASEGVKLALAGPLSMTGLVWGSAIGIGVRSTVTTTHAQGVELVAVAVAVSSRNVLTSAFVNGAWAIANAASIKGAY
ncbi:MAG: lipopolysaccharide biosynthesis protein, partial [Flavobacteriales bacterium]